MQHFNELEAACYVYLPIFTNVRGQVDTDLKAKFLLRGAPKSFREKTLCIALPFGAKVPNGFTAHVLSLLSCPWLAT
jgi:hypothetical protein